MEGRCTLFFRGRKPYRQGQLAMMSALLEGAQAADSGVIAGFIGGDMNAFGRTEHNLHKASNVNSKDVWEDVPAPPVPVLQPFQNDSLQGQARGSTLGYQSTSRQRTRTDKILYTGRVETVTLTEPQDTTGRFGRVGIGLKTEIEAWEHDTTETTRVRGSLVRTPHKEYFSRDCTPEGQTCRLTKIDAWVSDHFGIATGIRVV